MKMPSASALTLVVCALGALFPHGVYKRAVDADAARFRALSERVAGVESNLVEVARVASRGAGSGPVPVSGSATTGNNAPVSVPWRSFHAFGVWGIDAGPGRRLYCGDMCPWGLLISIGQTFAVCDGGTILSLDGVLTNDN